MGCRPRRAAGTGDNRICLLSANITFVTLDQTGEASKGPVAGLLLAECPKDARIGPFLFFPSGIKQSDDAIAATKTLGDGLCARQRACTLIVLQVHVRTAS